MTACLSQLAQSGFRELSQCFIAIVASICAWFSTHTDQARFERDVEREITSAGGQVFYGRFDWDGDNAAKGPQPAGFFASIRKLIFGERHICYVYLQNKELSPELAKRTAQLPHLEFFRSDDSKLGERHVQPFMTPHSLRGIHIRNNPVASDDALRGLSQLRGLRSLDLSGASISDKTWGEILQLTELRSLNIGRTKIEGRPKGKLDSLPALKEVWAEGCPVGDEFARILASSKQLTFIFLKNNHTITDDGVAFLAGHPSLEKVTLESDRLTDKSLDLFATIPNLKRLSIRGMAITREGKERFRILRNDVDLR